MNQLNSHATDERAAGSIEAKIDQVMRTLTEALLSVLDGVSHTPFRPQELARSLKLNKTLTSCVHRAVRAADPLAAAHLMPGPEALRMLLKAAGRKGVDRARIAVAEQAVSAFDNLIRCDVGTRSGLDAVISASLPAARKKFELANKQAAFKAMANLKGAMVEVHCTTCLAHPSEDAERNDLAVIVAMRGLRRVRPGAVAQVSTRYAGPDVGEMVSLTLDGKRAESIDGLLLRPYCSSPPPRLDVRQAGGCAQYIVADQGIGPDSAVDVVFAEIRQRGLARYQPAEGHRTSGAGAEVEQPVRTLVLDFLLHEEVWPGCEPELRIYDTTVRGVANPNDRGRDIDRLDVAESIEFLGHGPAKFRAVEIPNYLEMLRHVCGKLGWDAEKFRGYRCRIQYPVYGSQISVDFDPPERPQS